VASALQNAGTLVEPAAVLGSGYQIYQLSNSVTAADSQKKLGVTDAVGSRLAKLATSNATRRGGVFAVGAGAALVLIEVFDDGSSVVLHQERPWWQQYRWLIAVAIGAILFLLYMKLQKTGIFKSQ